MAPVLERLVSGTESPGYDTLAALSELASMLLESPAPAPNLLVQSSWTEIENDLTTWIRHGRARDGLRAELRRNFHEDFDQLDHESLTRRLSEAEGSRWPLSWWRTRGVGKVLATVSTSGAAPPKVVWKSILSKGSTLRVEQRRLDDASDHARGLLGRYWNGGEAEWDAISQVSEWSARLRALALRLAGDDLERVARYRESWARLTSEGREMLGSSGSFGLLLIRFREAFEEFEQARERFANTVTIDASREWGEASAPDLLARVQNSLNRWQSSFARLRDWCAWQRLRSEAVSRDLTPLVERYEAGDFETGTLPDVFDRSYLQWWLDTIVTAEPVLREFFSPEHERMIDEFRAVDDRYTSLTRSVIRARLRAKAPTSSGSELPNSELGILRREVGKKRRQMPVRQLFQRIPNLLPRLKPCVLMSPMSVAQYLDSSHALFDLVVFDEASQIPVWDAIGAIGRGKQTIVVGDPKQLPPTSFFQRAEEDEDVIEDDVVEDLESILDDCSKAGLPELPLDWHYRSRHESLITFSNYHYYRNRLLTFPSAITDGMGVSWIHVRDGTYDKGRSRTNKKEAEAVVSEVVRRLLDPGLSNLTIGIVTFSQAQQVLIEDLLDAARIRHPELESFFNGGSAEPVFVKNLENVQGDERDVILFSICYGPDDTGKVSMNFGPMNRDGGERRLNVAITRARQEVQVFSTLRADQIDLARTRATGVKHLKSFLAYAERGPSAIAEAIQLDPDADFDSPFEEAVHDALVQRGWDVHKQVGTARYRIDLAVVDPEAPGRYLLGVECDGANYHSAKTARDRDKLRAGVLKGLGWSLHRIWSTDWWTDPDREMVKLEEALQRKVGDARVDDAPRPVSPTVPEVHDAPAHAEPIERAESAEVAEPVDQAGLSWEGPGEAATPVASHDIYVEAIPSGPRMTQDDFYEGFRTNTILAHISEVVTAEGPVALELAAKRVTEHWGFGRMGSRALDRIRTLIECSPVQVHRSIGTEFLWPPDLSPDEYSDFRIPNEDGSGARQAEELPPEEVANAVLHILQSHFSAPVDEIVREAARIFGFQRVGTKVDVRMRAGIHLLVQRERVRLDGDTVILA